VVGNDNGVKLKIDTFAGTILIHIAIDSTFPRRLETGERRLSIGVDAEYLIQSRCADHLAGGLLQAANFERAIRSNDMFLQRNEHPQKHTGEYPQFAQADQHAFRVADRGQNLFHARLALGGQHETRQKRENDDTITIFRDEPKQVLATAAWLVGNSLQRSSRDFQPAVGTTYGVVVFS
jgi:hypothetical protein